MSETFKVSGKKFVLQSGSEKWSFVHRPGGWWIAEGPTGERHRVMVFENRGKLSASIGGRLFYGDVIPEQKHGAGASVGGDSDLTAQFPGKVRKVLVGEGAQVAEGDPLILVEAMKMEFSIKAPANGKITKVLVQEGQQLSPGDRFVDFEERAD